MGPKIDQFLANNRGQDGCLVAVTQDHSHTDGSERGRYGKKLEEVKRYLKSLNGVGVRAQIS